MKKIWVSTILMSAMFLTMACGLGNNNNDNEKDSSVSDVSESEESASESLVEISQWASSATASSEYGSSDWAAYQAVGEPDTSACADEVTAWASAKSNGVDWLELSYSVPVNPSKINILQTYSPSQVTEVVVYDLQGKEHNVYKAQPTNEAQCPYTLSINIKEANYQTQRIRITVDQSLLDTSWNEIDAVELIGMTTPEEAAQVQNQPAANNTGNIGSEGGSSASSNAAQFFYDELDGPLSNLWVEDAYYYVTEDTPEDDMNATPVYTIEQERGALKFFLETPWQYINYLYSPYTYDNVRIDYEIENKGVNSNNIGLICRYTDYGYYEFLASSGGYYSITRYYEDGNKELAYGGIKSIRIGTDKKNTFTAICNGSNLYFLVNDVEIASVYDDEITEGYAGLTIGAVDVVPVQVEINWLEISQP